ncbi:MULTISPECIES: chorismate mutase [Gordonia]|uniref:chorismate mutase n=1 Tax=Gordonia amicalis TaxID=89053 RepID=A0AAE4R270_9ACTN|nr:MULTISPECIES: chorismate mutase [Gordonia]ATD70522.1 chorismate mutase [Gordonia sp. 1D]MCZ4577508.1 chorismate mutase [Gordonia amicalis]MCZ4651137.1 chorismate mutase [Gordonia amicalis]MDJ0451498.1 chorismate mutase [Gordonia amicalis]MDV6305772.1 chorismate mutase [Gordonia amicalis]
MRLRGFLVGLMAASTLVAPPLSTPPLSAAAPSPALSGLTDAVAGRLALADAVAASKWASGAAIDDPAREQIVLETVSQLALDLDPAYVRTVFRDQIEASKTVQRGLFAQWRLPGQTAPAATPDLSAVRAAINELNVAIVDELAASRGIVTTLRCPPELVASTTRTAADLGFDPLHVAALVQAGASVCAVSTGSS